MIKILHFGRYLEIINKLPKGKAFISSVELARLAGVTASTVRQDFFNLLETKGRSKRGYEIERLRVNLMEIIGLDQVNPIVIIGAGKIGRAILGYREFAKINIHVTAFFDRKPELLNRRIDGIPVYPMDELGDFLRQHPDVKIAVIAVPEDQAVKAAFMAEKCGIHALWNFAPVIYEPVGDMIVENEYVGQTLYKLIYNLKHKSTSGRDHMDILVCVGSACHLKGAESIIKHFQSRIRKEKLDRQITIKGSFCQGKCSESGVTIRIGNSFFKTTPDEADGFFSTVILPRSGKAETMACG